MGVILWRCAFANFLLYCPPRAAFGAASSSSSQASSSEEVPNTCTDDLTVGRFDQKGSLKKAMLDRASVNRHQGFKAHQR